MRFSSFTIVMLLLSLTAGVAVAYPGPDSIGLYLDGNAPSVTTGDLSMNTSAGFEMVTIYLCITNPSLGGVSGWEALIEIEGTPIAPAWTLTAGLDVDPDPDQFQVGIGLSPLALLPNANGSVIVADWTGFIGSTYDEVKFYIRGVPESVTFDNLPGYASPTNASDLATLDNIFSDFNQPVFGINTDFTPPPVYDSWVNISAVHFGYVSWADDLNKAAQQSGAVAGFDSYDVIADDTNVVFIEPSISQELDIDVHPIIDPYTEDDQWTFLVRTSAVDGFDNTVDLDFTHSSSIQPDMGLHLLDRATSTWQDLNVNPSYSYTAPVGGGMQERVFDLFLGHEDYATPQFSIGIDAASEGLVDLGNIASTVFGATAGYDASFDTPEPPAAPAPSLALYFPHEEWGTFFGPRFMRDVRSPFEPALQMDTWTFTVDRAGDFGGGVPVVLDFTPSFSPDSDWLVRLRIHETGEVMDLGERGWTYSWVPGPGGSTSFDLMVGHPDTPALEPALRTVEAGWSLVGAPLLQPASASTYQSIMVDDAPGQTYVFGYEPGAGYSMLSPYETWTQGTGAWLGSDSTFDWDMVGVPDPGDVTLPLNEGWTLVGYPMWFPSNLMGVIVSYGSTFFSWADAVSANLVGADVYGYDDIADAYTPGTTLDTWHGYWFWANQPGVSVVFNFENMPTTTLRRWQPFADLTSEDNWRLDVNVEGTKSIITLGTCELSDDGFDAYLDRAPAPKSPVDVGGAELFFERPEWNLSTGAKVASDIRKPVVGLPHQWDAVLTAASGQVTLNWDPSTWGGTSDLQVYLPEQNRVVVSSMRAATSVTLDIHDATLAVQFRTPSLTGVEDEAPAVVASLEARPNPFNPQTELMFTSPVAGSATVRVYDVLGRMVTTLEGGSIAAGGQGRVTWQGRDAAGREVSSGTYFASLAVDGRVVGEIRKLSLVR